MVTKVINVAKHYGSGKNAVQAVQGISLDINAGDYIALLGPSGSGKTTLLSIIGCLIQPSSGEVYYNRKKVSDIPEREMADLRSREIGFVFQFTDLLKNLTVLENVLVPVLFQDGDPRDYAEYALELLDQLGLGGLSERRIYGLSGGERQRVAIARALINSPKLLLADEPTGDLDDNTAKLISALFDRCNRNGTTIVFVTHNKQLAKSAANIYEMGEGRIQRIIK